MGLFSRPEVIGPGVGSDADRARIAELERRVASLEAQLAQLARAASPAGVAPLTASATEPWLAEVQALRRAGKTIHAIKVYREHTGASLTQAKDAVEALPV
ncbi:hypothetical protein [Nocardioides sp. zg-1228]|uniref:hypothetical protein n=1 Tax=Nocardioides sp. zg-1228 TaxID=2763008 RepID=UPI0016436967|nr:hypothetical protein [Nocardioides sp. zg-1228]MBC2933065.1 hypothetical protein [Nocardioides sp. zg-1228]QSF56744.1 hypothetical protein JX575_14180 [Nocardioides sp. zg-1228]